MTQPITYYSDNHITRILSQIYGAHLEGMNQVSKLTFRAALSSYTLWKMIRSNTPIPELLIAGIEENNRLLDHQDPEVYDAIVACIDLSADDIESLILSLTEQIRDNCWSQDSQGDSQP